MKKARGVKGDSVQYTMLCNQLSKGIESLLLTEELDGANLWNFKLRSFDLPAFIVWNI